MNKIWFGVFVCCLSTSGGLNAQPPAGSDELPKGPTDAIVNHRVFVLERAEFYMNNPELTRGLGLSIEQEMKFKEMSGRFVKERDRSAKNYSIDLQELAKQESNLASRESKEIQLSIANRKDKFAMIEEYWSQLNESLSPEQVLKLEVVALQHSFIEAINMRRVGMASELADRLRLSEKESKDIEDALDSIRKQFAEEVMALRKEGIEKIIQSLPQRARVQLDSRIGEIYFEGHE